MLPVIAIVGRPNVGKSTLFNALTHTKNALVYDIPGVTRDRQYAPANYNDHSYIVIDTGGLSEGINDNVEIDSATQAQSLLAIEEADLIYFIVDAKAGLTPEDHYIAKLVRSRNTLGVLVVNKTDGMPEEIAAAEFYNLGFERLFAIAASHKRGINRLLEKTLLPLCQDSFSKSDFIDTQAQDGADRLRFALIGRPNVGKSTLTNLVLGQERVIVGDMPGTTVDSISIPFSRHGQNYIIIDTAGVRRRGKIKEALEKFSVIKTLQAIQSTDVVVAIIDAREGITDQDLHLIGFALNAGRALVIAVNKYDGISQAEKITLKTEIKRRLLFLKDYIDIHFISARHGTNVGHLFKSLQLAYQSARKQISTSALTRVLKMGTEKHKPPIAGKSRINLKYAHIGGYNPPMIVVHGNQVDQLPKSYQRYLEKFFRDAFNLIGTPIKLVFKQPDNPFQPQYKKGLAPDKGYKSKVTKSVVRNHRKAN